MAVLSQDPSMLRRGGACALLAVPVTLWLANDLRRDDQTAALAILGLAGFFLVVGGLILRRAASLTSQPVPGSGQATTLSKPLLVALPVGWIAFGLVYGLAEGDLLAFWLSFVPAAVTAGVAVYAWRRGLAR